MPTSVGPNTFGEENLVFGYDTGDTANSYKNPPATNLVHIDVARGTTSGWDGYSVHTGYGLVNNGNGEKDGRPDTVSVTWTDQGAGTQTGDWYPRFNLRNPDNSVVTTTGGEVFYASWEYKYEGEQFLTSGNPDFNTENFYGNGWKSGTHGSITTLYTQDLPFGWKRRTARIVAGDSGTTQTPLYRFGSGYKRANGGNFTLWLDNISITRNHPVHTWFPGRAEVAVDEGLIDLTGNSTIDLTNVSFDSNAQMTFDGTNDYIDLGDLGLGAGSFTVEAVIFPTLASTYHVFFRKGDDSTSNDNTDWSMGYDYNQFHVRAANASVAVNEYAGGSFVNNHGHVVLTYDGSTMRMYRNGTEVLNKGVTFANSYSNYSIGRGINNYAQLDVKSIKVYSKTLTASEIKANYNAIKGRFNI